MTRFELNTLMDAVGQCVESEGLRPFASRIDVPLGQVRGVIEGRNVSFDTIQKLADKLALEFYIGPPRSPIPAPEIDIDGQNFSTVPRHDAAAAAGGGVINFDAPPIDHLALSKTWLLQNGIRAEACSLISAIGQSMEPSIYDGDLIMIDHRKRDIHNRRIYVFNDRTNGTRIKRLELSKDVIAVHSDNPDKQEFPTEYHTGEEMNAISQNIIGEVVWSGHKWT